MSDIIEIFSYIMQKDVLQTLIHMENLEDINEKGVHGQTVLMWAARWGMLSVVERAIDLGADVDLSDSIGRTTLIIAVNKGNMECIKILLEHGSNVNLADNEGLTPLHHACKQKNKSNAEVIRLLLSCPSLNVMYAPYTPTPLHIAAYANDLVTVNMLLSAGLDVNAIQAKGKSALDIAAVFRHEDITKSLLKHGAKSLYTDLDNKAKRFLAIHSQ